jgi:hypothetical protein
MQALSPCVPILVVPIPPISNVSPIECKALTKNFSFQGGTLPLYCEQSIFDASIRDKTIKKIKKGQSIDGHDWHLSESQKNMTCVIVYRNIDISTFT